MKFTNITLAPFSLLLTLTSAANQYAFLPHPNFHHPTPLTPHRLNLYSTQTCASSSFIETLTLPSSGCVNIDFYNAYSAQVVAGSCIPTSMSFPSSHISPYS